MDNASHRWSRHWVYVQSGQTCKCRCRFFRVTAGCCHDITRSEWHAQVAIEPKTKADLDKMGTGLYKLAQEDPSFHFQRDDETNQTVIEVQWRSCPNYMFSYPVRLYLFSCSMWEDQPDRKGSTAVLDSR